MENASKALIIAGAILISILIISFGVIILGQGSDVINNANMSEAEIAAFNKKFEAYEGSHVRGSNVKQLMKTVAAHNRSQDAADKKIQINCTTESPLTATYTKLAENAGSLAINSNGEEGGQAKNIDSGKYYEVKCCYTSTGLINGIKVKLAS